MTVSLRLQEAAAREHHYFEYLGESFHDIGYQLVIVKRLFLVRITVWGAIL